MELAELKKKYMETAKKYKLPSFEELNTNFEIEKIEKDTDYILRAVRKMMMEKIVNSLGFLEMFLNPINTPRMYATYSRAMTVEDRKLVEQMYGTLGTLSIESLDLEVEYHEKREAETIKNINDEWNHVKPQFKEFLANMKKPQENNVRKEKSYFG